MSDIKYENQNSIYYMDSHYSTQSGVL